MAAKKMARPDQIKSELSRIRDLMVKAAEADAELRRTRSALWREGRELGLTFDVLGQASGIEPNAVLVNLRREEQRRERTARKLG
jgi:hypothetical protein